MTTLELLAPARDYVCGVAAVDFGADALYIGGPKFGARQAATNTAEAIARLVEYAHTYGVRVYVALNTLVFDHELAEAGRVAREMCACGADALIVQDMAYTRMDLPRDVELHASTQTCNTTPGGAAFLASSGFSRVILERGLTLDQIRAIRAATDVELEAFVHGAICVAYSGRCYMSRTLSARSGNRGDCMQACRLPYDLLDASGRPVVRGKHLLSVRDLNLSDRLGVLADAGVCSFKIEGRLKEIGYVKNVTAAYRRALDRVIADRPQLRRGSAGETAFDFGPSLEKSFTRGFTHYFLDGKRSGVASFDTPKAVGDLIGTVKNIARDHFMIDRAGVLHNGDGLCFAGPGGELSGTNVNRAEGVRVWPNRMEGIRPGTAVYRNYDHAFNVQLDRSRTVRKIAVCGELVMGGAELRLRLTDSDGTVAEASVAGPFAEADQPGRALDTLRRNCTKTGDTPFVIRELTVTGQPVRFVPAAAANTLRREALDRLKQARLAAHSRRPRRAEDPARPYPFLDDAAYLNVTNRLSAQFYRDHGVASPGIAPDLRRDLAGETVMTMSYCLRRELGECLRERPSLRGDLCLRHGQHLYDLRFDCGRCEMSVVYRGRADEKESSRP
ncbi:MAG: U32 family peptidase [Rikenellaceae bacterium]|nr:U32 family peptidase [Rikenellaceae bacterium]